MWIFPSIPAMRLLLQTDLQGTHLTRETGTRRGTPVLAPQPHTLSPTSRTEPRRHRAYYSQVAHGLMEALAGSGRAASSAQIAAAHQLAGALEAEEAHFLVLAGDPAFHPMQRTHFPIGKLLAAVKSHQELYDVVAEQWPQDGSRGAPLAQVRLGAQPCAERALHWHPSARRVPQHFQML